jgi:hypothetical protein
MILVKTKILPSAVHGIGLFANKTIPITLYIVPRKIKLPQKELAKI